MGKITTDKWVISIVKEGYKLEFVKKPPFLGIKKRNKPKRYGYFKYGIRKFIRKKCNIGSVKSTNSIRFLQHNFLVPKKTGELRTVINPKPLNFYL